MSNQTKSGNSGLLKGITEISFTEFDKHKTGVFSGESNYYGLN